MLKSLSKTIANKLVSAGADKSKCNVYAYGIECMLSTAIILLLLAVGGIIMDKFLHVLVFIAAWLPLRTLVGGSHANSHFMCTVMSVGFGLVSVALTDLVNSMTLAYVIIFVISSYTVIFLLAPVVHKNHPVSDAHRLKMRKIARIFSLLECALIVVLKLVHSEMLAPCFMGCFTTTILAVIGYFSKTAIKTFK